MSKKTKGKPIALLSGESTLLAKLPLPVTALSTGASKIVARLRRLELARIDAGPNGVMRIQCTDRGRDYLNGKPVMAPRLERAPTCMACGRPLKRFEDRSITGYGRMPPKQTVDGNPPVRGSYGDNAFCGISCGWEFAIRVLVSVPGVADLMPPELTPAGRAKAAKDARLAKRKAEREKRLAVVQPASDAPNEFTAHVPVGVTDGYADYVHWHANGVGANGRGTAICGAPIGVGGNLGYFSTNGDETTCPTCRAALEALERHRANLYPAGVL